MPEKRLPPRPDPTREPEKDYRDPPTDLVEAIGELTVQTARVARAIEDAGFLSPGPGGLGAALPLPSIRYADTVPPAPRTPRTLSDKLRQKRVSLPAAAGWSTGVLVAIELLRVVLSHLP